MLRLFVVACLAVFLIPAGTALAVSSTYTQNWDDSSAGTAGWVGVIANTAASWGDTGGNPDGFLRTTLQNAGGVRDVGPRALRAIPDLIGDYSQAAWTMNFDIMLEEGSLNAAVVRLRGQPSLGGGWVADLGTLPSVGSGWMAASVSFDGGWSEAQARANGWMPDNEHPDLAPNAQDSMSWAETLVNVRAVSIRLSGNAPVLTSGIDNFALSSRPLVPTPEPSAAILIGLGLCALAGRKDSRAS